MGDWTVFSNHGHVLVCLANNNEARLRDVAASVGITERAVQKIVRELQQADFISISKHGRCNRYEVNIRKNLRHPLQSSCTVGVLLKALSGSSNRNRKSGGEVAKPEDSMKKPAAEPEVQVKGKSAVRGEPKVQGRAEPKVESQAETGAEPKVETTAGPVTEVGTESKPTEQAAGKRGEKIDTRQQGSLF